MLSLIPRVFIIYMKKIISIRTAFIYAANLRLIRPITLSSVQIIIHRPHIIRTAPGKGYKLVNQPAGVRFIYAGESQDFYRIKLTENITGYIRKSDARLEPPGTAVPKGEVSRIAVDNFPKYVQISMKIGDQLPYEIQQSISTV